VQDADISDGHAFPHKVEVDINMLRALMLNGVGVEVDGADVVTVDECALRQRSVAASRTRPRHWPCPGT
jgi:TPP-dependent pyruvate/acetoin dehydrogenase alpha subunit